MRNGDIYFPLEFNSYHIRLMDKAAYVPVSVKWDDVVVMSVLQNKRMRKRQIGQKGSGPQPASYYTSKACSFHVDKAAGVWRSG